MVFICVSVINLCKLLAFRLSLYYTMFYSMTHIESFLALLLSSATLPLLAFLAVLLRRKAVSGKLKTVTLVVSLLGLAAVIVGEFFHHGSEFGAHELYAAIVVSVLTFILLARHPHNHAHGEKSGAKGIVLAEAFHSIFDGAALGVTFLVTPLLGIGAALGIVVHEVPKMLATLALLRSIGLSMKQTIFYGALAQIGAPVTAIIVYLFGMRIETEFHIADAAVLASLSTIVLYILYLEIRYHRKHDHTGHVH